MHNMTNRDERGVAMVLFALLATMLIGTVGLSVDVGNAVLQRSRVQNAVDSAALAIARDCALDPATCSAGVDISANFYAVENANGADVHPVDLDLEAREVKVEAVKEVPTIFMRLLDVDSKDVSAYAVAAWGGHPTAGSPVLPLGISWCTYAENLPETNRRLLLRTDLVSRVRQVAKNELVSNLSNVLRDVSSECDGPSGNRIEMLDGSMWLAGLSAGVGEDFHWDSSACNLRISQVFVGVATSSVIPNKCMDRLVRDVRVGQTLLLPVYQPAESLMTSMGLTTRVHPSKGLSVDNPPSLGLDIVGFAPFRVTGWQYPSSARRDPTMASCATITSVGLGCDGIQGYFVNSVSKDPAFDYGAGEDLGAAYVKLIDEENE